MTKPLDLARIRAALVGTPVGQRIDYYESVASTMPLAHALAADPTVATGAVVVAEEQTAGRGRGQRRWETPVGSALLVSLLLKAPLPFDPAQAPMVAGLALVQACLAWQPALQGRIGLKWPNDLLLGRTRPHGAKTAGILVESSYRGDQVDHLVIGMGLNVLQTPAELPPSLPGAPPPTSLRHFLVSEGLVGPAQPLDRTALFIELCRAWSAYLVLGSAGALITQPWRDQLWTVGQAVAIYDGGSEPVVRGVAVDVTTTGHLVVADETGVRHSFAAGDVSLRGAG